MAENENFTANSYIEDDGYKNIAVTAEYVLESLFDPDDTVNFRVFDDKKGGVFQGQKLSCKCAEYKSLEPELKRHNAQNRGIFFVVNYGGQTDDSITRINAQFVEMDEGTFDEQQKKIDAFPLPPSMVIRTRKSMHVYWCMDKSAKVSQFRELQKRLVKHFNGDPACVNESRVMRLPGFNHCKTDTPVMVTCTCFHPERKYTQEQLADVLPELAEATAVPVERRNGTEKGLDIVMRSCLFLKHCKDDAATLSEPEWYAMISNLAQFDGGTEMIHALSKPYPGYSERATQQKINHFLESGTGPITCQSICEKGFQCPKFAQGGCGVKSPAALCYLPLASDVLIDMLRGLPITGKPITDIQTAKQFVEDYLYNQDPLTADEIINTEMKRYFNLRSSQLKSLYKIYVEKNKAFAAKGSAELAKKAVNLPDWYEPTSHDPSFRPGVLAQHLAETERVFYSAHQYYRYGGGVYVPMHRDEAQRIVQAAMLPRYTKSVQIADAESQWQLSVMRSKCELNPNPYIINLKNGLYDVLEETLTSHNHKYLSTVQLPVNYDEHAKCPLFQQFLTDAMCEDIEQVNLIQEIMGYCLIPVTAAQKCFVFSGAAGAGKSVLLRVISDILLGHENVSNVSWQALNERFKLASLEGKLANIFADLPTRNIEDNGIFKALVGEDYLSAERKFHDSYNFKPTARLLFSCNSIPKNYGDKSEGFYRRLILIKFNRSVPQENRDPNLLEKFRTEADGILMFALAGLKRLMRNNYKFSETQVNIDELQRYREDSDSALSFVRDNCECGASFASGSSELYAAYQAYCRQSGLHYCEHKTFVQRLTSNYRIMRGVDKVGGKRILKGIRMV